MPGARRTTQVHQAHQGHQAHQAHQAHQNLMASPDNVKGVLWALVATALLTIAAAMAKLAMIDYHVLQILFFRQLVIFASAVPTFARAFPQSLKTSYPGLHVVRLVGAFIGLTCSIWAVGVLPLTTATTLAFAQVFFVALFAFHFLGEKVGIYRCAAIIAGFIGVVIVMRPGVDGLIDVRALIPIAGALGAAIAVTSVRALSQSETTTTLLMYQAVVIGALAGVPLFWLWTTPDLAGLIFLLAMGVVATLGQWAGVKALRAGEASVVGNIEYVKLIYAAALGLVLFNELPDAYTLIGAAIIIAAAIMLYWRAALARKQHGH